jgi:hypothetical protein
MKYIYDEKKMAFHKFYWFTSILRALSAISTLALVLTGTYEPADKELFYLCAGIEYGDFVGVLSAFLVVELILNIVVFVKLKNREKAGWYAVMAYWIFIIVYVLYNLRYCNDNMQAYGSIIGYIVPTSIWELMVPLLFHSFVAFYYFRRKPLFFAELQKDDDTYTFNNNDNEEAYTFNRESDSDNLKTIDSTNSFTEEKNDTEDSGKLFCRQCGKELPLDSEYCSSCGTKVIKF